MTLDVMDDSVKCTSMNRYTRQHALQFKSTEGNVLGRANIHKYMQYEMEKCKRQ